MLKMLLEVNLQLLNSEAVFRLYPVLLCVLHRWRNRGRGRWLTEWQWGIESGSIISQRCYQLTGLCSHITLGLQLGHSRHRDVKGMGLMTACPKLVEHTVCRKLALCIVGRLFHHIRMWPGQSHRHLSSAAGVAAMLLCRAVAAGSQTQVAKGSDSGKFWCGSFCHCTAVVAHSWKHFFFFWISHEGLWSLCLNMSNEKK